MWWWVVYWCWLWWLGLLLCLLWWLFWSWFCYIFGMYLWVCWLVFIVFDWWINFKLLNWLLCSCWSCLWFFLIWMVICLLVCLCWSVCLFFWGRVFVELVLWFWLMRLWWVRWRIVMDVVGCCWNGRVVVLLVMVICFWWIGSWMIFLMVGILDFFWYLVWLVVWCWCGCGRGDCVYLMCFFCYVFVWLIVGLFFCFDWCL